MECQLYTTEYIAVKINNDEMKNRYFFPVQQKTIIAKPIPAPAKANQGKVLL